MRQAEVFLEGEGEAWLKRNKPKLITDDDPVLAAIAAAAIVPNEVLEIGCANGWRLLALRKRYGCSITGIDPGINPASRADKNLFVGTADDLPFAQCFDVVIYGFCLYLCDREDLFKIVAEGDRVLRDGGYLIIHDFHNIVPVKKSYHHKEGVFSYKMDYSHLWLANPAYTQAKRSIQDNGTVVVVLKKDLSSAWPNE